MNGTAFVFTMPQLLCLFRLKSAIWTGQNLISLLQVYIKKGVSPKLELRLINHPTDDKWNWTNALHIKFMYTYIYFHNQYKGTKMYYSSLLFLFPTLFLFYQWPFPNAKHIYEKKNHNIQEGFMEFFEEEKGKVRARETVSSIMSSACRVAVFGAGIAALACLLRR